MFTSARRTVDLGASALDLRARAPDSPDMRLLAPLGALATAGSLWLHWYGVLPGRLAVTGWEALQGADTLLAVAAAVVFVAVVVEDALTPIARLAALVAVGVVVAKIVDRPADAGLVHLATGVWVALGGAVAMVAGIFARGDGV
jgi:hypothetical protein